MLPISRFLRVLRSRRSRAAAAVLLSAAGCAAPPGKSPGGTHADGGSTPATKLPALTAGTYCAHANLLERQGNFTGAEAHYRRALELQPDNLVALNRLGITLNKLGRHAAATEAFERAVALHPDQAHLFNNLGFSLILEGRFTEAEKATRRALELRPRFARARMNHAVALAKLARFDEAYRELTQVNGPADALYNLAMLQADAGAYDLAVASLERSLVINPQRDDARRELEKLLARRLAAAAPRAAQPATPQPALAADASGGAAAPDPATAVDIATDAASSTAAEPIAPEMTPDGAVAIADDDCGDADDAAAQPAQPIGADNAYFGGESTAAGELDADDAECIENDATIDGELPWFDVRLDDLPEFTPAWFESFALTGAVEPAPPGLDPARAAPADVPERLAAPARFAPWFDWVAAQARAVIRAAIESRAAVSGETRREPPTLD